MFSALHPIEKTIIAALSKGSGLYLDDLVRSTDLQSDQVRRAIEWLSSKGLVETHQEVGDQVKFTGTQPPELKLVSKLSQAGDVLFIKDLKASFDSEEEFSAALGRAKRAGWITIERRESLDVARLADSGGPTVVRGILESTTGKGVGLDTLRDHGDIVSDLIRRGILTVEHSKHTFVKLTPRGQISASAATSATPSASVNEIDRLTPELLSSGGWRGKKLRSIDVEADAPRFYPGRRHPIRDFIREVREAYISMGFTELEGNSVQPAFWNFDALFIPQDHPGREMQDTFYLQGLADRKLARAGLVERVARTHEDGWKTGSSGWGYSWSVEEARRLVLRTHNTVLTVKALSETKEREVRVFAVSKIYRNENLDYKHLAEFHQMDGIIVGEGLNVRHLMGFLKEFYKKLGLTDVKLWPSYFPYTEPSLQIVAYSKKAKDWIELGGSGVFRPEVTWPLGVRVPVLAWGPGIERLMLLRYGLDDMRQLYTGDLSWYRGRREIASS